MNWEAVGAIGEIVGAAAVVVTLVFLILQIRHGTQAARAQSLNTALGTHVHQIALLTATEDAASLFRRFCRSFYDLSLDDRGRMHSALLDRLASFNQVARLHETGLLDDNEFAAMRRTFVAILRTRGGREWWSAYRHMIPEDLDQVVSNLIDDPEVTGRPITDEQPWLFEDTGRA